MLSSNAKRYIAKVRAKYPVLMFIPGLALGQLLACLIGHASLLVLALWLAAAFFAKGRPFASLYLTMLSGLLPGVLSMLSVGPLPLKDDLSGQRLLIAQIESEPRFRQPGQMECPVRVLAQGKRTSAERLPVYVPIAGQPKALCKAVHLPWRNMSNARVGSIILLKAQLRPLRPVLNPFARESTLVRQGYNWECRIQYASAAILFNEPLLSRIRRAVVQKIRTGLGNNEGSGLIMAIAFGRRDVISASTENAFKRTGLAHLLVLSGCQVTLIWYSVFKALKWVMLRLPGVCLITPLTPLASLGGLTIAGVFVAISGVDGSSLRAMLALVFVVIACLLERNREMPGSIGVSFMALCMLWPGAYLEPGVQLTYAALVGIWMGQRWSNGRGLLSHVKVYSCASLCTSIVSVLWFKQISLAGFVLNPVFAPLISVIGCHGAISAVLLSFVPIIGGYYALRPVMAILELLRDWILVLSNLPGVSIRINGPARFAVALIGLLLVLRLFSLCRLRQTER